MNDIINFLRRCVLFFTIVFLMYMAYVFAISNNVVAHEQAHAQNCRIHGGQYKIEYSQPIPFIPLYDSGTTYCYGADDVKELRLINAMNEMVDYPVAYQEGFILNIGIILALLSVFKNYFVGA